MKQKLRSFLNDAREAVVGTDQDFTEGRMSRAILTGTLVSVLIAVPGTIYAEKLLDLIGASGEIINHMSGYTKIMMGGS